MFAVRCQVILRITEYFIDAENFYEQNIFTSCETTCVRVFVHVRNMCDITDTQHATCISSERIRKKITAMGKRRNKRKQYYGILHSQKNESDWEIQFPFVGRLNILIECQMKIEGIPSSTNKRFHITRLSYLNINSDKRCGWSESMNDSFSMYSNRTGF